MQAVANTSSSDSEQQSCCIKGSPWITCTSFKYTRSETLYSKKIGYDGLSWKGAFSNRLLETCGEVGLFEGRACSREFAQDGIPIGLDVAAQENSRRCGTG